MQSMKTQEKFYFEKIEKLKLFSKVPHILLQWVNYEVPTWEPLVLMFPQMANGIACHSVTNNKVKELHCVLKRLNVYDNEAELVLMSALGDVESDDSSAFDSDPESCPPNLTLQAGTVFSFFNGSCSTLYVEDTSCCLSVKLLKYRLYDENKIPIEEGVKQPSVNTLFSSSSICNSDGVPHLYEFNDIIIAEKDSNISSCQHDNHNSSVQSISKSK
eukprot:4500809-Ditylum_brightwellii.AAC.1